MVKRFRPQIWKDFDKKIKTNVPIYFNFFSHQKKGEEPDSNEDKLLVNYNPIFIFFSGNF